MRIKVFKTGAVVSVDRSMPSGMYTVMLRNPQGEVADKVRCDDYGEAMAYRRAFEAIAKRKYA